MTSFECYIDKIKEGGFKMTPQRQEVLKALSEERMQTAEEIHQQVLVNQPNVSLDTIYRNLKLLQQLNIICESDFGDGKSRYKLSHEKHHHHLICIKCGCSETLEFCPMDLIKDDIVSKKFKVTNHNFEIFGYCSNCI
jgi:Fur family zinc uptake transcriptional regulator/Fur family ferric uptake transcriptional regulator